MAALAMARAAQVFKSDEYRKAARASAEFLLRAQNPGAGWRSGVRPGDNDTPSTAWALFALAEARAAGIEIPDKAIGGGFQWLDKVTSKETGQVGYLSKNSLRIVTPGVNDDYANHPTWTAMSLYARSLWDRSEKAPERKGRALLLSDLPSRKGPKGNPVDYDYWLHGTTALARLTGRTGKGWEKWRKAVVDVLLEMQIKDGCAAGSWPAESRWGSMGGRVYATAANVLTLIRAQDSGKGTR